MVQKPIFIAGVERSGKSILSAFLNSHPFIAFPKRGTYMWSYYYRSYGTLESAQNLERCLNDMFLYKHINQLNPDPQRIRREFAKGPPTYPRLFAIFLMHYAEQQQKPRWGYQAAFLERYTHPIMESFPRAMIIHLVRDPRDRHYASLSRAKSSNIQVGETTARWIHSTTLNMRNTRLFPERYRIIRYEDLVRHPEATLRELCTFLEEEYHPAMLTMEGSPDYRNKISSTEEENWPIPVHQGYVGQFREELAPIDIKFIQDNTQMIMKQLGYQPEPMKNTIKNTPLAVLTSRMYQQSRMRAWFVQEKLRTLYPAWFGRSPEKNKLLKEAPGKTS